MSEPNYGIDPGTIAAADQCRQAVRADLDTLIESYRHHVGKTDETAAYVVLWDNMCDVLTFDQAVETLAVATQRISELEALRDAALRLHRPGVANPDACYECSLVADPLVVVWPCPTAVALGATT